MTSRTRIVGERAQVLVHVDGVPYYGSAYGLIEAIEKLHVILKEHGAPVPDWIQEVFDVLGAHVILREASK